MPSGIAQVGKRAVRESAESASAREVFLIEEPMAAAIGAGLPITEPICNMIVDMRSMRIAGDKMDTSNIQYIKRKYNLLIG